MPDVQERVTRYFEQDALFQDMLRRLLLHQGNVVVTDLRGVDPIHSGNRFLVYALFPEQNTSIWIVNGRGNQNCVFACGHSILNRTSQTHIGALMRAARRRRPRGGGNLPGRARRRRSHPARPARAMNQAERRTALPAPPKPLSQLRASVRWRCFW